ncbi:hypothetical protein BH23CYA1_BH23CYA1_18810 [soil metagenome]
MTLIYEKSSEWRSTRQGHLGVPVTSCYCYLSSYESHTQGHRLTPAVTQGYFVSERDIEPYWAIDLL